MDEIAEELTGVWSENFIVPDFFTLIVSLSELISAFTYEWKYDKLKNIFTITGLPFLIQGLGTRVGFTKIMEIPKDTDINTAGGIISALNNFNHSIGITETIDFDTVNENNIKEIQQETNFKVYGPLINVKNATNQFVMLDDTRLFSPRSIKFDPPSYEENTFPSNMYSVF